MYGLLEIPHIAAQTLRMPMAGLKFLLLFYVPFLLFSLICKLCFWVHFIYHQRATLSNIPGPKWAARTRLWLVKTLASGESAERFVEINKKYGERPKLRSYPRLLAQANWLVSDRTT